MWLPAAKHSQNKNKTLGFGPKLFLMCYVVVPTIDFGLDLFLEDRGGAKVYVVILLQ